MKASTYFLIICLLALPWALRAEELPIVFARSGQKVAFPIRGDRRESDRPVALWTFGQRWDGPVIVNGGVASLWRQRCESPSFFG